VRASIATAIILAVSAPATAATHCVNPGGTGGCFATIQGAVSAAASKDLIDVAAGTYVESVEIPDRAKLTIQGAGMGATIVQAPPMTGAVFHGSTFQELEKSTLAFQDLTIQGPATQAMSLFGTKLSFVRVRITGFLSEGINLACAGSRLVAVESEFDGNGIAVRGGGCSPGSSSLSLIASTIHDNGAGIDGPKVVSIDRSTITNNGPGIHGGALTRFGRASISFSTIADNQSALTGGVAVLGKASVTVRASIIANNTGGGSGNDCSGVITTRGANVIEDVTGCSFKRPNATDQIGVDPQLDPLASNGGPTQTRALAPTSPALGAVDSSALCRQPDQRMALRTKPCDAGSFEAP